MSRINYVAGSIDAREIFALRRDLFRAIYPIAELHSPRGLRGQTDNVRGLAGKDGEELPGGVGFHELRVVPLNDGRRVSRLGRHAGEVAGQGQPIGDRAMPQRIVGPWTEVITSGLRCIHCGSRGEERTESRLNPRKVPQIPCFLTGWPHRAGFFRAEGQPRAGIVWYLDGPAA